MGISIEIEGALSRVKNLEKGVKNVDPPLRAAIIKISKFVMNNFETGGAGAGGWKELSKGRLARKVKEGYNGGILVYRGSMKSKWGFIYGKNSAAYQSFEAYSKIHESGSGRIPQRKILPTDEQAEQIVRDTFEQWKDDLLK